MKNILLISTGLSPQIVTETLYYYHKINKPSIHFSEVHIVTDNTGSKIVKKEIISRGGQFHRFLKDYSIDPSSTNLSLETLHVVSDEKNKPIHDLRSISDNKIAVSKIFSVVEKLTQKEDTRLFTSVAGGRKTMSVIIGQAMQFFGRKKDRIIHVVVDDLLFRSKDFYYPTPYKKIIKFNGKSIDISKADVNVHELPFIRLRPMLGEIINVKNSKSLADLVSSAQKQIEDIIKPVSVNVILSQSELRINDYNISLPRKNLAVYTALLSLRQENNYSNGFLDPYTMIEKEFLEKYLSFYTIMNPPSSTLVARENDRILNNTERSNFYTVEWAQETKSKINRILKQSLPKNIFEASHILSIGDYGNRLYGISIDINNIRIDN